MNNKPNRLRSLAAIGLAGLLVFGAPISQSNAQSVPETIDPIKIPNFNFSDSDFILTVLGGVLERMGYNVEYVTADYIAAFTAIETGDLHIFGAWEVHRMGASERRRQRRQRNQLWPYDRDRRGLVVPEVHGGDLPGPAQLGSAQESGLRQGVDRGRDGAARSFH